MGDPRYVQADTTLRGSPAGRDDSTRLTRLGSLSAGPSADTKLVFCARHQWTTCEGNTQAGQTPGKLTLASRVEVAQGYTVLEKPVV
jgi:hypothetical protein